jgi:uncharacterized protein (TIGR02285 family)
VLAFFRFFRFFLLILPLMAAAQEVQVIYRDKPPYTYTDGGQPAGFLMKRTGDVFRAAGIDARYLEVPLRRILQDIQDNQRPICSPGWYRLPEREAFARFSLPIHQDKPHVVLAHAASVAAVKAHRRVADLLGDPALTLGVVEGISYGADLDRSIATTARPPMRAMVTPLQLAKMIAARRADYMFIDQEDMGWLRQNSDFNTLELQRIDMPDMPAGLQRYLMCSLKVELAQMERLNQAIRQGATDSARP